MKITYDFIANSSSCSFVIVGAEEHIKAAAAVFREIFSGCDIPYEVENALRIGCSVKNKWFAEVEKALCGESRYESYYSDWRTGEMKEKDPEEISWNEIEITFSSFAELAERKDLAEKIDSVRFSCDDNMADVVFLNLFYAFFERNGCKPDATGTEHSFLGDERANDFLRRLTAASGGKTPEARKKGNA